MPQAARGGAEPEGLNVPPFAERAAAPRIGRAPAMAKSCPARYDFQSARKQHPRNTRKGTDKETPMTMTVKPLSPALGAEVTGIDLRQPLDPATVEAIR